MPAPCVCIGVMARGFCVMDEKSTGFILTFFYLWDFIMSHKTTYHRLTSPEEYAEMLRNKYEVMPDYKVEGNIEKKKVCIAAIARKLFDLSRGYESGEIRADEVARALKTISFDLSRFETKVSGYYHEVSIPHLPESPKVSYEMPNRRKPDVFFLDDDAE